MKAILPALALLSCATGAQAASVVFDFSQPGGNYGNVKTFNSGGMSVTASGFSATNVAKALYGKQGGGNENGLGFARNGDREIGYGEGYVQLDVSALLGLLTNVKFGSNSTTQGEEWSVFGSNTAGLFASGTFLSKGTTEGLHTLPNFGAYKYYYFTSSQAKGGKNWLLTGISGMQAVPEPATWMMLIVSFFAVGSVMRRRNGVRWAGVSYS